MSYQESIEKIKPEMEKAVEHFQQEAKKLRTGQASPSLVEDVEVNVFGQNMALKQLAGISTPERRQLLIQPWDKSYLEPIEKALAQGELGASPIVESDTIRITLPALTQEFREKLLKLLSEKEEEAKQNLRKWRDEAWSEIQERTRNGEVREDDKFKGKEELQTIIDNYTQAVEDIAKRKEADIRET